MVPKSVLLHCMLRNIRPFVPKSNFQPLGAQLLIGSHMSCCYMLYLQPLHILIGPCKGGGVRDSGFKFQTGQGFRIQISKWVRFRIQISKWVRFRILGFRFQSYFLGFKFKRGRDSGLKFQIGGIQDSDLGLQGPSHSGL